jgi:hypothetical protein
VIIAVANWSTTLTDDVIEFGVQAVNDQMAEAAEAWKVPVMPMMFFSRNASLPPGSTMLFGINDNISEAGALGFHADFGGIAYGEIKAQDPISTLITLGHEGIEGNIDPTADQWIGSRAKEGCDAVQSDTAPASPPPRIGSEVRPQLLTNYVLPAYFDPDSSGPWDKMGRVKAPLTPTPGGYEITRDAAGNVKLVFARTREGEIIHSIGLAAKLEHPRSRVNLRLRSRPEPWAPGRAA